MTGLADRLARYVSIADQDVGKALIQGIIKPDEPGLCSYITRCKLSSVIFSEYAENLAYEVNLDFGNEFKTWQSEDRNRNKGSKAKVRKNVSKEKSKHFLVFCRHANGFRCGTHISGRMPPRLLSLRRFKSVVEEKT